MFNITELEINRVSHTFFHPEKENIGRKGRHREDMAPQQCMDPESFDRGGPTLTVFFFFLQLIRGTKCYEKRAF